MSPFQGVGLNPIFVLMLDLSDEEVIELEDALAVAQMRFREIKNQAATGNLSADGKTLVVTVPTMPVAGGMLYDALLDSFASVMGPDRFALFMPFH